MTAVFAQRQRAAGHRPRRLRARPASTPSRRGRRRCRRAGGGTGTVRWRASAPGTRRWTGRCGRCPTRSRCGTGPAGEDRVSGAFDGTLFEAGPLAAGWKTYTNNGAVFGQLGDRFAIDGAGADLWKGTAEFGTAYRAGALRDGGSVTVKVDAQAVTGAWARAGIVVRDASPRPVRRASSNLAVTPANGVVLSYDTNGDGTLDTYKRITGIKAPVLLRLTRAQGSYTGACSTDDGATWRTVATVSVPGAAGPQDVGLFMSATNGGSGARGTVEFSGWTLSDDTALSP